MEHNVNSLHVKGIEGEEIVSVHHIREASECLLLIAFNVQEYGASHVAHALDVADVRPEKRVSQEDVLQWLVQRAASPEMSELSEGPMQVFLDDFQVLLESSTLYLLHVLLLQVITRSLKKQFV